MTDRFVYCHACGDAVKANLRGCIPCQQRAAAYEKHVRAILETIPWGRVILERFKS